MFRSLVRRAGGAASGGERCDVLVWSARIHSRMTAPPAPSFRVVALLSAYNEADVIGETIGALIGDGVEVPRELAGRELDVEVAGGSEVVPDLAEPESLDDLIRNVSTRYPSDALVVSVRMPGQGVTLRGRVIPNLPGSALDALRPSVSTESGEPFQNFRRTVVPVGRVVLGRDRVRLRVREVRL